MSSFATLKRSRIKSVSSVKSRKNKESFKNKKKPFGGRKTINGRGWSKSLNDKKKRKK